MTKKNTETKRIYDLEERTAIFGEAVIDFSKALPQNVITRPVITQFVKCGTSIGANYCEADDAESIKDFIHKCGICKKECRETRFWLRMIVRAVPDVNDRAKALWKEAKELSMIFNSIIIKSKDSSKKPKE